MKKWMDGNAADFHETFFTLVLMQRNSGISGVVLASEVMASVALVIAVAVELVNSIVASIVAVAALVMASVV